MYHVFTMNAATETTKTLVTYQVVLPSGAVVTFNSSKTPTHAVIATAMVYSSGRTETREGCLSTHSNLKAGLKGAATARARGWVGVEVVECKPA